jgi:hypothetical protein
MSDDPLIERLTQFTPDGGKLDRDALLFAAGRASARPSRGWAVLAAALATSQLLTLALLSWPRHVEPTFSTFLPTPRPITLVAPPPTAANSSVWVARERYLQGAGDVARGEPIELTPSSETSLRAFGPLPEELWQSVMVDSSQGDRP